MLAFWFQQRLTSIREVESRILAREVLYVGVVVLVFLLVGCGSEGSSGSQVNQAILGKWTGQCSFPKSYSAFKQAEFLAGGTVILDGQSGQYSSVDNQRIKIQYGSYGVVFTYSVAGGTLTLTDYSGTSCTLNRAT